jgi:poly(A) polymerase
MQDRAAELWDKARGVVETLRGAGFVAYFAGGCVRDRLLGIAPKDVDVATDAPPQRVRELFKKTQAVGQAFGVILVRLGRDQIEVATFRTDGKYEDGRHPTAVTFSNAEEDAKRRDFTINGLFYDPMSDRVIDYVGGRADLDARVLRAIGDAKQRFAEDHLRMLRAVRFAARFGLTIDTATADAIRRDAHLLPRISGERIADELRRMLPPPTRRRAVAMLWENDLVGHAIGTKLHDVPLRAEKSLANALPDADVGFPVALLCLAIDVRWHAGGCKHDILGNLAPAETTKIVTALRGLLKLSNDEAEEMLSAARLAHALLNARDWPVAMVKRTLANRHSGSMRLLLRSLAQTDVARERIAQIDARLDEFCDVDCAPAPLLTGDHLVAAGYAPGPAFKRVLDEVYDAQLEGRVSSRDEAMALGRELLR